MCAVSRSVGCMHLTRFRRLSVILGLAMVLGACSSDENADPDPSRESVVVEFLLEQNDRWRAGDIEWMVEQLHSSTFQFWTPEQCVQVLTDNRDLGTNRLEEIGDLMYLAAAAFDYGQGRVAQFNDLYNVEVVQGTQEGSVNSTLTIAFEDGEPKWFGSCDARPVT